MYDQYKKYITQSEYGGAKPMVKETFGKFLSPYPKIYARLKSSLSKHQAKPWSPQKYAFFHDRALFEDLN